LQGRIQSSPAVEQQYKELTRNYQNALEFYNDLLKKHDQAAISSDLNRQQQGEHFNVLDPASLPMTHLSRRKRRSRVGAGGGLALGLTILYLLSAFDPSMHTERDVEVCLQLPVLAVVPDVAPAGRMQASNNGHGLKLAGTRT